MNRKNIIYLALGILLVALSAWQTALAQKGLEVINLRTSNPPVTIIQPAGNSPASRPTVLIAHGFAGSGVLMRGFAFTLAHAGYTTISWDFEGHGTNPNPLLLTSESSDLLREAEDALSLATSFEKIDERQVAILGHSMGSGVALSFGVTYPETSATIAISPVPQAVTSTLPRNLLAMAGSLEPQFVSNAEHLLTMAGGEGGQLSAGTARQLAVIPNVEHISILFSPTAHRTARNWLDGTFGTQFGATNYIDRRIMWYSVGMLGFIFLSVASTNSFRLNGYHPTSLSPLWLRIIALIGGALAGTVILRLISLVGVNLSQLFGLLVGGYLIVWFGVAGLINLAISRPHITKPSRKELLMTVIPFAALWLGVGFIGNFVWIPWLLIPNRLWLWIPCAITVFPWFLAVAETASKSNPAGQVGWWFAQVVTVIAGLYLSINLTPSLGFLFLILPVVPIMLGLQSLAITPKRSPWAYAISGALFTSWLLLAVFPLQ